jgi:hypothetical protein
MKILPGWGRCKIAVYQLWGGAPLFLQILLDIKGEVVLL